MVFVLSSNYEGFPNVLVEAMSFGLPCISTNCPSGPSEIINSGHNGILIKVGDENALINNLNSLISNPELAHKFSEQAVKDTTQFEVEVIVKKWKILIENLIDK